MDQRPEDHWQPNSASKYLAALDEYLETIVRLFPTLPWRVVANWSILPVDALAIGYFLEHYPRRVVALDVGTFVGASAFCLTRHPKVSRVISVDPNPVLPDEIVANSDRWNTVDLALLEDLKVLDIARAAFAEFDAEQEKVRFSEGVIGSTQVGVKRGSLAGLEKVEVPAADPSGEEGFVALVDALHTREGVRADLEAIFGRNPRAVVLLDDCRHHWGPFVQAGVVDFMEQTDAQYHFGLIGDLGPGLARSNLGVLYPDAIADETKRVLAGVNGSFSQRLDPLRLLSREEDLIAAANRLNRESFQAREEFVERSSMLEAQVSKLVERSSMLEAQISKLEARNEKLLAHYSSRRYKLADEVVDRALQIPGLGRMKRQ